MTERDDQLTAATVMRQRMDAALPGKLTTIQSSLFIDDSTGLAMTVIELEGKDIGGENVMVTLVRDATRRVRSQMDKHADDVATEYETQEVALRTRLGL